MLIVGILVRVSIAVMKHHNQSNLGRKALFVLHIHINTVHHQRKSEQKLKHSKKLEVGADAEAVEELCLLAFSS